VKFSFRKLNFMCRNRNSRSGNRAPRVPHCARNTRNCARNLPHCNFTHRNGSSGYPRMKFRRPLRASRHPEPRSTYRNLRFARRNCAYMGQIDVETLWK
jgi:hypothetical protein